MPPLAAMSSTAIRRSGIRAIGVVLAHLIASLAADNATAEPTRPNIVVILVDDMGFSDLGCYGGEIPTPHLDALAAGGLRFTQCYNSARCCPTRASLLTGLYPHQAGVGHMTDDAHLPGYRGRLDDDCPTIAEALRDAGYFTCMAGKWHVGQNHGVAPWNRGFTRSLNPAAGGFYFAGSPRYDLSLDGEAIAADDPRLPQDWYTTDLWTTFGLKFIDEARAAHKPFILYLAHNAPHFPLQARAEEIAKFRGRYRDGWDALARRRVERQQQLGLVDPRWTPAARPATVSAWDSLPPEEQERFEHLMAVYATTVHLMDRAVGDLVAGLRDRGLLDDTLILFLSDNGGNAESGPAGRTVGDPTRPDSSWFCGEGWAWLQNVPFRKSKHFVHEGGIATPLIAHWPKGIAARGEWRSQPVHVIDILPTCLDVASAPVPKSRDGRPAAPPEGRSLTAAFRGEQLRRDAIFWEHEGNAAVRVGDLKLVRSGRDGPWELYNLAADRTEQHDLVAERPADAADLAATWRAWAERVHAEPGPAKKER
ncbi:MAG: arylsulfatase [Planctomycetaceae bacterium]